MTRKFTSLFAVVALLASALQAQRMSETVQVTVVEVPVTVVDRDGNAVRGLTAENFEVSDDGKRVPIEYFEVLDLPTLTAQPTRETVPLPPAATRHFLLMFDVANSSPGTIGRASEAAKEFVENHLGERDLAAVSVFTAERGARMITNFTRNRSLLINAIETLGHPNYFKVGDPLLISAVRAVPDRGAAGAGSEVRQAIDDAFELMAKEQQAMQERALDSEKRGRLRIQLTNMGAVARALDKLSGQKQIILLSEGFDASLVTGREDLGSSAGRTESTNVVTGQLWDVDSEQRFGSASASRDISDMVDLFKRSDVVLHAIDIKGLRGNSDVTTPGGTAKKSFESLFLITQPTGGSVFKNANDMGENFEKLLKQQEVVYILGFKTTSTGKPGKFHSLKVKPVNVRGARVTHRAGYYEPGEVTDLERALTLADILMTDAPIDDIAVNVTATPLPGPSNRARVPVVVELPGSRLLQGLSGKKATAEVFLYAFDKDSQVVDFLQERITLDLEKAGETVRGAGVRYYGTLRLPPGQYAVKTAVRVEESGLIGFTRNDVTVPTFAQATVVPPMLFTAPGNWAMIVGPARGDDYAYPFSAGEEKFVPKQNPAIAAMGDYKVALFLVGVPLENLSVTPTLVSGGAEKPADVTLIGRTAADDRGVYKLLFNFKSKQIAAGHHELRFDVTGKDGLKSTVTLPFTVQ